MSKISQNVSPDVEKLSNDGFDNSSPLLKKKNAGNKININNKIDTLNNTEYLNYTKGCEAGHGTGLTTKKSTSPRMVLKEKPPKAHFRPGSPPNGASPGSSKKTTPHEPSRLPEKKRLSEELLKNLENELPGQNSLLSKKLADLGRLSFNGFKSTMEMSDHWGSRSNQEDNEMNTCSEIFNILNIEGEETISSECITDLFDSVGIRSDDIRISGIMARLKEKNALRREIQLDPEEFSAVIKGHTVLILKSLKGALTVPDWMRFTKEIKEIYNKVRDNDEGTLADYIPVLAKADPKLFAIACCTVDGQMLDIGCTDYQFCVQSCCKPISYLMASQLKGFDCVHNHMGREPSGQRFNELTLKSFPSRGNQNRRIPHNPMINSGAIMSTSLIKEKDPLSERFSHIMDTWEKLCGSNLGFSNSVYLSEKDTADRNWCLGYMMQEYASFPVGTSLDQTLDFYFQQCSIEARISQMSILAATLANGGANPISGERIFDPFHVRNCLSLMLTCGMYDYSGEWCFTVGLPAKSGVSGCIYCVIPNKMGIAVFSPKLDENGNSVRGVAVFQELVEKYTFHQYDSLKGVLSGAGIQKRKVDPTLKYNEFNSNMISRILFAAAEGDLHELTSLHAEGGNLFCADYDNRTAIHLAASEGRYQIVKFLCKQAKISSHSSSEIKELLSPRDRWGRTPLDDAVSGGHEKVANLLRNCSASRGAGEEKMASPFRIGLNNRESVFRANSNLGSNDGHDDTSMSRKSTTKSNTISRQSTLNARKTNRKLDV